MYGPISPKLTEIDQSRLNGLKMTKWTEVDRYRPKVDWMDQTEPEIYAIVAK